MNQSAILDKIWQVKIYTYDQIDPYQKWQIAVSLSIAYIAGIAETSRMYNMQRIIHDILTGSIYLLFSIITLKGN